MYAPNKQTNTLGCEGNEQKRIFNNACLINSLKNKSFSLTVVLYTSEICKKSYFSSNKTPNIKNIEYFYVLTVGQMYRILYCAMIFKITIKSMLSNVNMLC